MRYPNFSLEKKLFNQGYKNIVGIDEVGRGAWAGPLVAVATIITKSQPPRNKKNSNSKLQIINRIKIKDSKLVSEKNREVIFEKLSKRIVWSIGIVSHKEIDQKGLSWANTMVVKRAVKNLAIQPDYLLIDNINGFRHPQPHQLIVDGDRKVLSIAIASILAKVIRDRMMREFHQKFPQYNFHQHKGYGTRQHLLCLKKYGVCKIHRLSYEPIRKLFS